jgi:CubicO group peptidase (beta-lactamase class C family)
MLLVDDGKLDLDERVATYLPEFARGGKGNVCIRNLLLHNSGLAAFHLYYKRLATADAVFDSICAEPLAYPTGTRTVYSDLGFITLGRVIERIAGRPLDVFTRERIFAPLGMRNTLYRPPEPLRARCAPTEVDTYWRMRRVQGTVHDETADLLGGVSGHAGLFSTAGDLARFAQMLLDRGMSGGRRFLRAETVDLFTRCVPPGSRALGWDTRSAAGSSAGHWFSLRSYGHTGFTGTSLWIDPEQRSFVVFLTNRVHPTRENKRLLAFRAVLHDAVREAMLRAR